MESNTSGLVRLMAWRIRYIRWKWNTSCIWKVIMSRYFLLVNPKVKLTMNYGTCYIDKCVGTLGSGLMIMSWTMLLEKHTPKVYGILGLNSCMCAWKNENNKLCAIKQMMSLRDIKMKHHFNKLKELLMSRLQYWVLT